MSARRVFHCLPRPGCSGIIYGQSEADILPGKLNVKIGSRLVYILIFSMVLVFSWLLFFCVFWSVFVFFLASRL